MCAVGHGESRLARSALPQRAGFEQLQTFRAFGHVEQQMLWASRRDLSAGHLLCSRGHPFRVERARVRRTGHDAARRRVCHVGQRVSDLFVAESPEWSRDATRAFRLKLAIFLGNQHEPMTLGARGCRTARSRSCRTARACCDHRTCRRRRRRGSRRRCFRAAQFWSVSRDIFRPRVAPAPATASRQRSEACRQQVAPKSPLYG